MSKRRRTIPFSMLPWMRGMEGKTRARAEAEYYYEQGEELDLILLKIDFDDEEDKEYSYKKLKIDLKYDHVTKEEYEYEKIKIDIPKHKSPEYLLAKLELDWKNKKIEEKNDYLKQKATLNNESWVTIAGEFDPKEGLNGLGVELDWNDLFIEELKAEGYTGLNDLELIRQYFATVCRTVAEEEGIMDELFDRSHPVNPPPGSLTDNLDAGPVNINRLIKDDGKAEYS